MKINPIQNTFTRTGGGYGKRLLQACLPWGLAALLYCFFGPLSLIHSNADVLGFDILDAAGCFAMLFAAVTAAAACLTALMRPPAYDAVLRFVFSFSLASYVQRAFMNPDYALMDGRQIPWSDWGSKALVNIAIWAGIFFVLYLVSVYFAVHWKKLLWGGCALLMVMQLASLVPMFIQDQRQRVQAREDSQSYYLSTERLTTVSGQKNVILFLLDATSNSALKSTLDKYPQSLETFRDFTYFTNCAPTFYGTYPELISMLTGSAAYDTNASYRDFETASWTSDKAETFYALLQENGFRTDMFIFDQRYLSSAYSNVSGKLDNAIPGEPADKVQMDVPLLLREMTEFSVFTYAPIGFKAPFQPLPDKLSQIRIVSQDDQVFEGNYSSCVQFYPRLCEEGLTTNPQNQFSVYHLWGAHPPYISDENCQSLSQADGVVEDQTQGYLKLVDTYLEQLRDMGVYDDSLIIVMADHGDSAWYGAKRDPSAAFLIKSFGESHASLRFNGAPISHLDVLPTIAEAIAPGAGGALGQTVYQIPEGAPRERILYSWYDTGEASISDQRYTHFLRFGYDVDINDFDETASPREMLELYDSFY